MSALELPCYVAGRPVRAGRSLEVLYPYGGGLAGTVPMVGEHELNAAVESGLSGGPTPSHYERHQILDRARLLLTERAEEFANLIRSESGLCIRDTKHEVHRSKDVLRMAAVEALKDNGESFPCDVSPHGRPRKIFTLRDPVRMVAAITPFNHPLNQVVHKLAPAIAAGAPVILKPSEKTPLSAIRFAELLYDAGLPGWMLSVLLGSVEELVEPLITDERIELVSFTGSVRVGKRIAATVGYKKLSLELGGNSPLIICKDADLDVAAGLAAEGSFRNSGQRCTAVKRILVDASVLEEFTRRLVEKTRAYVCGDPADPATRVGTVIDEIAAVRLESVVQDAVERGAILLAGGERQGALLQPTVIANVPRDSEMVCVESFGPLAPIMAVADLDDAIDLANATPYGLAAGVVTNDLEAATKAVKGIRTGTVNVNEVPGYRIESSPFGGVKDSGLGIKEGVVEAMKYMTNLKTFSLPW